MIDKSAIQIANIQAQQERNSADIGNLTKLVNDHLVHYNAHLIHYAELIGHLRALKWVVSLGIFMYIVKAIGLLPGIGG